MPILSVQAGLETRPLPDIPFSRTGGFSDLLHPTLYPT